MSDCLPAAVVYKTARLQPNGYVVVGDAYKPKRKSIYAHRHTYEQCFGTIPDGAEIHHACRRRDCVNPEHLELMATKREHVAKHRPTHCHRGHVLAGDNLIVTKRTGHMQCRTCRRLAQAQPEYRARRNARRRAQNASK